MSVKETLCGKNWKVAWIRNQEEEDFLGLLNKTDMEKALEIDSWLVLNTGVLLSLPWGQCSFLLVTEIDLLNILWWILYFQRLPFCEWKLVCRGFVFNMNIMLSPLIYWQSFIWTSPFIYIAIYLFTNELITFVQVLKHDDRAYTLDTYPPPHT